MSKKKPRKLKKDYRQQYERAQPMQGIAQQPEQVGEPEEPQSNPLPLSLEAPLIPEIPPIEETIELPATMEELERELRKNPPSLSPQQSTSPQQEPEPSQELPDQAPEDNGFNTVEGLPSHQSVVDEELQLIANIRKNTGLGPETVTEQQDEDFPPSGTSKAKEDEPPRDEELYQVADAIRNYCVGHSIALVLKAICEEVPEALPNYRTWNCKVDPIDVIRDIIHTKNYVESLVPSLRMMMGANVKNIQWSARVVIAMTAFHAVRTITWQESGVMRDGIFEIEREYAKRHESS